MDLRGKLGGAAADGAPLREARGKRRTAPDGVAPGPLEDALALHGGLVLLVHCIHLRDERRHDTTCAKRRHRSKRRHGVMPQLEKSEIGGAATLVAADGCDERARRVNHIYGTPEGLRDAR